MKSKNLMMATILMLSATTANAQQNIQKAFDALLNDNVIETKTQHSVDRDPETGKKTAQSDVYDFMVSNPSGLNHVKAIQKAFEKDKDAAYQLRTVSHPGSDHMSLAVGDGRSQSVAIGKMKGSNYIYACFLDKDDPEKKFRYAYAMEWLEKGEKTQVRLAITYATTQEYRKKNPKIKKIFVNGKELKLNPGKWTGFEGDSIFIGGEKSSESWLSEFNTYKNLFLKKPDGAAANYYATYIYNLCKKTKPLDDAEKKMVAKEIKKLKAKTEDEFIQDLFEMSIERLKK